MVSRGRRVMWVELTSSSLRSRVRRFNQERERASIGRCLSHRDSLQEEYQRKPNHSSIQEHCESVENL
jgi:hypothetical protein